MIKKYVIINRSDVASVNFGKVFETSADTLRYNFKKDSPGDKTFVKFVGSTPDFLDGKAQYTHSEILAILATAEWSPPR